MKRLIFLIILSNFLTLLNGNDIEVKIYSNKNELGENEIFRLSIEVSNANNFDFEEDPKFDPSIVTLKSEQSMNVSIINGRYSSTYTITMYLKPTKKGVYTIGPFKLKIKNNIYTTNQIEINVKEQSKNNSSSNYDEEDNNYSRVYSDTPKKDRKIRNIDYLIELYVSKKDVYIDEPIDISVNLYIRNQLQTINYTGLKLPSNAWIEKLEGKDNYAGRVLKDGLYYEHYIVENKRIFISKEGKYEIPPVVYNFYGMSGSSFFFFTEPMSIQTEPVTINVKSLPPNQNRDFKGAVGDFKINYNLNPQQLKTKEYATLIITLEGEGNFHNIKEIPYKIEGDVEQYSSTQDIKSGDNKYKVKKWEIILVP
ncbi:MAG: BatD family protein, partial [Candidatus Omnitrophica bacterium]|nr:BatD family protein [Candidatus Omnitrophota bacterium]